MFALPSEESVAIQTVVQTSYLLFLSPQKLVQGSEVEDWRWLTHLK